MLSFRLPEDFVDRYRSMPSPLGFGALGQVVFYRTYARQIDENQLETWVDTCARIIAGMYSIQRDYCLENFRPWSDDKAMESAKEAFDRLFHLKWSPPGRGIAHMGSPSVHERGMIEALFNCAYISTSSIKEYRGAIFGWAMEMLMLGVGVGFDVNGAEKVRVVSPGTARKLYVIPDTREGWVESTEMLVSSFLPVNEQRGVAVEFDYGLIRPKGEPIRGLGGIASGPLPLIEMHDQIRTILSSRDGQLMSVRDIADIMNMIGRVVVSGNVRRSSEILLGKPTEELINLKNYAVNPERAAWSWASNNSIYATLGMDYSPYIDLIMDNGEPGFVWMENANNYARMNGISDQRDKATGANPCGEIFLYGYSSEGIGGELCTLVDLYPDRHEDLYDFLRSVKFAYLYGKSVTLLNEKIKHKGTRAIMTENRRIGLSLTGIAQFIARRGVGELVKWTGTGYSYAKHYDKYYSNWLGINESLRISTIKPGGTVGLISGSTPGVHYPHSEYYIRRMRLSEDSYLADRLRGAGVQVEKDFYSPNTLVASFPIHAGNNIRSAKSLTVWEQINVAALMQKYWSDNSVSVTISVNPHNTTKEELKSALDFAQYSLKSVSMLPEVDGGAYEQMPYEEIDKDTFARMENEINLSALANLDKINMGSAAMQDMFCDGVACEIKSSR